ncbi:MAG: right-handed parallel beta-helix repeat-containing protein [Bacteroidota bacterium]
MKNYVPLVAISLFLTTQILNAQTVHTGEITVDSKFKKAENPHVIKGMVTVEPGVELIVEPGAVVQFEDPDDELRVYGTLIAEGTVSEKISFIGNNPDSEIHGEGIRFRPGSVNNSLSYCELIKLGDYTSVNEAIIYNEGDDLRIANCVISDSELWGIYSIYGTLQIENTQISNCYYDALAVEFGDVQINNSQFENCNEDGIELFSTVTDFQILNSTLSGNNGIGLKASSILNNFRIEDCNFSSNSIDLKLHPFNASQISSITASTIHLKGSLYSGMEIDINNVNQIDGVDYIVEYIQVNDGAQLNIGPGTKLGFINEYSEIQVYGTMQAIGLVSDSIQFLGVNSDPSIYGEGLRFHPGSANNKLQYCYIEKLGDADSNIGSSIWYEGDGMELSHCKISDTESRGIYVVRTNLNVEHSVFENCENGVAITETGGLNMVHSDFVNCATGIVQYVSGTGLVEVHESNFAGSANFAVDNQSVQVIDASDNYWGDPTGPSHSTNAGGTGDLVSDSVDYGIINSALTENQINIGNGGVILEGQVAQSLHVVDYNSNYNLQTRVTNWSNISLSSCDISCDVNGSHVDIPWTGNLNFSEFADEDLGNVPLSATDINTIAISLNTPNGTLQDNNTDNDSLEVEVLVNPTETHYAVQLDGSDDFIDLSSVAEDLGQNFSFELWLKPYSQGSVLEIEEGGTERFRIGRSGDQIKIYENGLNVAELNSSTLLENYWHHIAYTKDGAIGTLFVDGRFVGTHNSDVTLNATQSWIAGQELQCEIDEIRVWSDARSLAELRNWWNKENVEAEAGLLSVIHFREYFETRYYDYSNYNHCEVYGAVQIVSGAPIRDIDEADVTAITCYYENIGNTVYSCDLSVCNGTALTIGAFPDEDTWNWSWTGPNEFASSDREVEVSTAMDDSFNGAYRVVYEDANGFYAEQTFNVNSFDATNIRVELQLDNNPEETTWELVDELGNAVAFGGPYAPSDAGTLISQVVCAPTDCGEFKIYDSADNGICCTNGIGYYRIYDANEELLAYGSAFGTEGIKSICPEANEATCNINTFDSNSFESSWGIWNDGGANCVLYNYAPFASEGSKFVYLRGNGATSQMTTDELELEGYDRLTINFNYYSYFNSATSDNFKLQVSTDGGASYTTLQQWNYGVDFANDQYYPASVQIPGPFTNEMKIRIQGDVSNYYIFIDEVVIETCGEAVPDPCVDQLIDITDLEAGWGIWNDGGNNSFRYNNSSFASNGSYFILLRGKNNSSVTYTDNLDLSTYDEVSVDFNYYSYAMENGDQWHFEISDDGGTTYTTLETFVYGTDYDNGGYFGEKITLAAPFSSTTRFRFRQNANNSDYLLLDEIEISGCTNDTRSIVYSTADIDINADFEQKSNEYNLLDEELLVMNIFPNPSNNQVNVEFELIEDSDFMVEILDLNGKVQKSLSLFEFAGKKRLLVQTDDLSAGLYMVRLTVGDKQVYKKLVVKH